MEEFVYDDEGQMMNANLLDSAADVDGCSDFIIEHIETPTTDAIGGFKGVGEAGVIGAVPSLVNAINDAQLANLGADIGDNP